MHFLSYFFACYRCFKARKVGSTFTDKVKTFTATGLGLIVISIVIGFGTIVIAKIKHANVVTKLSEDEVFKMPVVSKLCKFVTF